MLSVWRNARRPVCHFPVGCLHGVLTLNPLRRGTPPSRAAISRGVQSLGSGHTRSRQVDCRLKQAELCPSLVHFSSKAKPGNKKARQAAAKQASNPKQASDAGKSSAQAAPGKQGGSGKQASGPILLSVKGGGKTLPGGRVLFQDVNFTITQGTKIGVLGVNGAGKSCLMKMLAGLDAEVEGAVSRREGIKIRYLAQEPQLNLTKDVMGNIREGIAEQEGLLRRFEELSVQMGNPEADLDALLEEQAELQAKIDELDAWNLDHRVHIAMDKLHVAPPGSPVASLSGGEKRRVALCRLLLEQPDVILLDEPTNHLDADSVRWLEDYLLAFKGAVISITHDRYFLDNVASQILEVDRGEVFAFEGNYTAWLKAKHLRLDLEKSKEKQTARKLQEELEWIQRKKGTGMKAKRNSYEKLLEDSRQGRQRLMQLEAGNIVIPPGPRLGDRVLELDKVSKGYDGRTLFRDVSFVMRPGMVVGVVGPNGSGKTTLFNIIAGHLKADNGTVTWGNTTDVGIVSQLRADLDPTKSVYKEIAQGEDFVQVGDRQLAIRKYVATFNLKGTVQEKLVGSLSGGERNRVHLAKVLKSGHNVLLLDEPTNDLDVDTLRALEDALREFAGCAMIISHDRWFLDRICTDTLIFEDNGHVAHFDGTISEYSHQGKQRVDAARVGAVR